MRVDTIFSHTQNIPICITSLSSISQPNHVLQPGPDLTTVMQKGERGFIGQLRFQSNIFLTPAKGFLLSMNNFGRHSRYLR